MTTREIREPRNTATSNIDKPTSDHDRPGRKTEATEKTTITYEEFLAKEHERTMNPQDRLLELELQTELEARMELRDIPTGLLEAELNKRQKVAMSEADKLTEAKFDEMSASIFGRQTETETETDKTTEEDLDAKSAAIFGRPA
jgi:hypothetical protein